MGRPRACHRGAVRVTHPRGQRVATGVVAYPPRLSHEIHGMASGVPGIFSGGENLDILKTWVSGGQVIRVM